MKNLFLPFLFIPIFLFSQKDIYIPLEWQQGSLDYSFDRSAESENFITFWGPLAGSDPTQAPQEIAFDPQSILATAEELYKFYIDTIRFVNDDTGLISQYKIILVMLHTWEGIEGWAFGGNYDGVVGAMWMHPHAASSGPTLAHEFTHTLQNYTWMMNPGHGFIDSSYVGFFWETHAEFMSLQRYPSVALEFDMARWYNTNQYHWSSTRHHYQAFIFLQFIKERYGIELINRMWNESIIGEHPLQTLMRLLGITQDELNHLFAEYAMRNVTWDYEIGDLLKERDATLPEVFVHHRTIFPQGDGEFFSVKPVDAPQDYGYNIIRLIPDTLDHCGSRITHLHMQGQTLYPDFEEQGLLYGFVAIDQAGKPRYGDIYSDHTEVVFEMEDDEVELYLVVTGAPQRHHNYAWEIGYPKVYKYPYDFRIVNARPQQRSDIIQNLPPGVSGAPHSNGGGFVASTAYVDPAAYVSAGAQVLDNATVSGNAKIEGFAIVKQNAFIEDEAIIKDFAVVGEDAHIHGQAVIMGEGRVYGSSNIYGDALVGENAQVFNTEIFDSAQVKGNAFCWGAKLYGDVVLGGDAEFFSECHDGTYLQVSWAYDRNCDGLDDHPANEDVSSHYFSSETLNAYNLTCNGLVENLFYYNEYSMCEGDTFEFHGQSLTTSGEYIFIAESVDGGDTIEILWLEVWDPLTAYAFVDLCHGDSIDFYGHMITQPGLYEFFVDTFACGIIFQTSVNEIIIDTTIQHLGDRLRAVAQDVIFQWFDCDTGLPVDGAVQRTFKPSQSGNYRVRLTTIEECEAYSPCYYVSTTATDLLSENLEWHIVPNPVTEFVHVQFGDGLNTGLELKITDMLGNAVLAERFSQGETTAVSVVLLPAGSYLLTVTTPTGHSSSKLFVKI
jgi:carbonic anhydrase/acetyltransferase-like protein (isoleucine patch superfamily)